MKLLIAGGVVPPDPEGDKITAFLARKYGLTDYEAYLKRLKALNHPPGFKYPWPKDFAPKKRKVTWDGKPLVRKAT
jgi:hypothetical protein